MTARQTLRESNLAQTLAQQTWRESVMAQTMAVKIQMVSTMAQMMDAMMLMEHLTPKELNLIAKKVLCREERRFED